jgi:hypothetical protein
MAKKGKGKGKGKKLSTIDKYIKSRGKEKYTYKKPTVKYDPYASSREQALRPASYDRIRQEQNKKRFEEAEKQMGKKYQIYDAIEDFSPGQIRSAQRRLGIKNATKKKEGRRILKELINPTPMMAPPPPPITPLPPPPPPTKESKKDDIDKYIESQINPLKKQLRQLGKSDPTANALAALQQTIAGFQMPDYSADIEDLKTDQENYMKELAEQQAAAERRRELAFRTSQENIARGELTPDFSIGARSPRDRFGTSAFRRRPRYTSTTAQGIVPTTTGKTLNI